MFSSDRSVRTLQELVAEVRRYLELQKRYVKLEFVSKLIVLLSALILGLLMFLIGAVAFILIAFCLASLVGDITGSQTIGYAAVALLFVLIALLVYANRRRWITAPLVRFLGGLFLTDDGDEK